MDELINNYDLFIFDLDDTIVKTEKYHYQAWLLTLKHFLNDDKFYFDFYFYCSKFHSFEYNSIQNYLINELKIDSLLIEQLYNEKTQRYLTLINYNRNKLVLIDGFENFINKIINNNKQFLIVTNTSKCNLDFFIELFPILQKSTKNYYRELLINKKPHPECYINVVNDFQLKKIIGFEDSITGIHALSLVSDIDIIFINSHDYYHFEYIQQNYSITKIIKNYC